MLHFSVLTLYVSILRSVTLRSIDTLCLSTIKRKREVFPKLGCHCKEESTFQKDIFLLSKNKKGEILPSSVKIVMFSQYLDTMKKRFPAFNIQIIFETLLSI